MLDPNRLLLEGIADYAILLLDTRGCISHWSSSAHKLFGYESNEILGQHFTLFTKDQSPNAERNEELQMAAAHGRFEDVGWRKRKDDTAFWADSVICPMRDENGTLQGYSWIVHDISERKKAADSLRLKEAELAQARKMEAVGRLAGGVAHDFNNFITGIMGLAEDIRQSMSEQDPRRADLDEIIKTSKMASDLTRELLAFGRKQISQPRVINLNATIQEKQKLLLRLVGSTIQLHLDLDPHVRHILIDPTHLDQIIVNLVMNSRDAMPEGGWIRIKTQQMPSTTTGLGPLIELQITDSGIGMDESILSHIFEPFFTTKDQGKGSGLGLATVYGIVKQNHGDIQVESRRGEGSTFTIRFPAMDVPQEVQAPPVKATSRPCTETLLVVEDTHTIQRVMTHALERCGYRVLAASSGYEAIERAENFNGPIHLLITDVIMPGMNGRQLAERMEHIHPEAGVIFISAYAEEFVQDLGVSKKGRFIEKPFTCSTLIKKVREILDSPQTHPALPAAQ